MLTFPASLVENLTDAGRRGVLATPTLGQVASLLSVIQSDYGNGVGGLGLRAVQQFYETALALG